MSAQSSTASSSLLNSPSHPVGYLAILAALVTGVLHLFLGPQVVGFSQLLGVLFILNGLGFLGGIGLYLSRYWRREFYALAAVYALITVIALFVFQGFSIEVFYRQGSLNPMAVISKAAELVLAVCAGYLYTATGQ